jgi:hypothetical protein
MATTRQKTSGQQRCSRCGGTTIDRLPRSRAIDKVLGVLKLRPYRCRRCYFRFYRPILRKTRAEEITPTKLQADNRKDEEISAAKVESASFREQMIAVLAGSKIQLSVLDEESFGSKGRYRINVRDLSVEETWEIIEALAAINLVER